MRLKFLFAASSAALLLAACGPREPGEPEEVPQTPGDDENATAAAEPSEPAPEAAERTDRAAQREKLASENLAKSAKFLAENAKTDGVKVTESGLQYLVVEEGPDNGATPVSTDRVSVHYVGTLSDGVEFDSSRARGAAATFRLNQVIPGWTEGVQLMSEGDKYRFFIPPELGYGKSGTPGGPIGPNEALIFDVELIKVESPERNLQTANDFLAENKKKANVKVTDSGLQYEVITEGKEDGASPSAEDTVKVHYAGTLVNGTEFDSSYARGEPIEFPLNRVIAGWTEGVQLMSEGDKFRFFIPPELAYGERGKGPIGPNEALVFEVELIEVKDAGAE
ncbi:MAG: FKBP-type peptidyl-prolyl cis-trans isomerase [Pseudomonadota bacterium]